MSSLSIHPVSSRREKKQFLELPWAINRHDPNWIPPLRMDQKQLVGYARHPFYENAEVQTFLATRGGKPVGRVAAIVNHVHNLRHQENLGFFGFFESENDPEVASRLFDEARQWFAQYDIAHLRGPCNPSLNYTCGLLVDGFEDTPYFMMTYNPPYYAQLLEQYGFQKKQDLLAFWGHIGMLGNLNPKMKKVREQATERFGVKIRPMNRKRFLQDVETFLDIYNQSMSSTWGFTPLSDAEIKHTAASLKHLLIPELALVAEVEGRPIGCVLCLLDYNPRIKAIDGRLFPFGFLQLMTKRKKIKRMRLLAANVIPEYQRWGIGLILAQGLVAKVKDWGIEQAEFSWVMESNLASRGTLERGGAKLTKTYRLYDLVPQAPATQQVEPTESASNS